MSTNNAVLKVIDLKTRFFTRRGVVKAVEGVNFELRLGECLCLVGESGCGKSVSVLSILGLIDSPPGKIVGGEARYNNFDLLKCLPEELRRIRGREIAMIFQDAQSALNPVFTVGEQITEQIKVHLKLRPKEANGRAVRLLEEMKIPSAETVMDRYPHQLSGGMRQRAMIAMSLSCDPKILIADEPTTAVDATVRAQILDLFNELKMHRKMSLIFITHDLGVVSEIGDRAAIIYAGRDVETAPVTEIINNPKHPYTMGLLDCLPDFTKADDRLVSIPGSTPDPTALPGGCPFHPRCFYVMDICREQEPKILSLSPEHSVSCHLYKARG
jgi:peptide/nickel transport system ATP-binding protein